VEVDKPVPSRSPTLPPPGPGRRRGGGSRPAENRVLSCPSGAGTECYLSRLRRYTVTETHFGGRRRADNRHMLHIVSQMSSGVSARASLQAAGREAVSGGG
jgi:hypothetical protein